MLILRAAVSAGGIVMEKWRDGAAMHQSKRGILWLTELELARELDRVL